MPKLLFFLPCEKVIIDQSNNTVSLIDILEAIHIALSESEEANIPADVGVSLVWHLIAVWQAEPNDADKELEVRFAIASPLGEEFNLGEAKSFRFEADKPNFRNLIRVIGFPLKALLHGERCFMRVWIRERREDLPWKLAADYPLIIRRNKQSEGDAKP